MAPEYEYEDEDAKKAEANAGANARFKEFDCPSCNANNPADPPFGDGEEVLCNYCGQEYRVKVSEEGRLKLKEI
jgi:transcription elongation factor Elf1